MSWDDYRFNGLRSTLKDSRDSWITIRNLASAQGSDYTYQEAKGRVDGLETALRALDLWVLAVQEGEAEKTP